MKEIEIWYRCKFCNTLSGNASELLNHVEIAHKWDLIESMSKL